MAGFTGVILQKALYDHLMNDPALMGQVTGVFDQVKEGQTFPYITMGEVTISDWSSKTFNGEEHLLEFHIWSTHKGSKEIREIAEKLYDRLDQPDLTIADHHLVTINFGFFQNFYEEDHGIRHGILRFTARIMAI